MKTEPRRINHAGLTALLGYSALTQAFIGEPAIYATLKLGTYCGFAVVILNLFLNSRMDLRNPIIIWFTAVVYIDLIIRVILLISGCSGVLLHSVLLLPIALMVIGYNVQGDLNTGQIAYVYGLCSACAGLYVIFTYRGMTQPATSQYFFASKNQLGAMLGASIAILIYKFLSTLRNGRQFGIGALVILLLIANNTWLLLQLRNRSAIVGIIVLIVLTLVKVIMSKDAPNVMRFGPILAVFIISIFGGRGLYSLVAESLQAGRNTDDLDNLSSGRVDVYANSLEYLKNNFVLGDLGEISGLESPHNFVLYQLVRYGLLVSLGILVVYGFLVLRLVAEWAKIDIVDLHPWAYLFLVAMVVSVFEYAQPFGPASTQVVTWLMFGDSLRRRQSTC